MSNPFKEIENENIQSFYSGPREQRVRSGLGSTLGTVRFLGKIADVYLTRLVDTVVGLAGGSGSRGDNPVMRNDRTPPNQPSPEFGSEPAGPKGDPEAGR